MPWTDSGLLGFFVVMIGLQVLSFIVWVKSAICRWLFFWLSRKQIADDVLYYLRANSFPGPREYEENAQAYFQGVADTKHLPIDLRIKAAVEVGAFNTYYLLGFSEHLMMCLAHEDALQRYKQTFPAKAST